MPCHVARLLPLLGLAVLAACSTQPPPARVATAPAPPKAVAGPVALSPIHASVSEAERIWHLRAALNVAALSCQSVSGPGIVRNYNLVLSRHAATLSQAYGAKAARYRQTGGKGWQRAMDQEMTRLYNHWAWPPAQADFCAAADGVARRAATVPPADFSRYALQGLAEVDRPIARSRTSSIRLVSATPMPARR